MTAQIHIRHRFGMYVVSIRDNILVRVEKYIGDTQHPREVRFEELQPEVQDKILDHITQLLDD